MPHFSNTSRERLMTCDSRIITILSDVILHVDFSVLCGYRGEAEQNLAFDGGNSKLKFPNSRHNKIPSLAVDIAPWFTAKPHIRWRDFEAFHRLAGAVLYVAKVRGIEMTWGGFWKMKDMPHFQVNARS